MQKIQKELKLKIKDFQIIKNQITELEMKIQNNKLDIFKKAIIEVCQDYGVSAEEIMSNTRKRSIVLPRQIAMYKLHKLGFKLLEIGKLFGGKDHTTIIHAIRKIEEQKDIYSDIKL